MFVELPVSIYTRCIVMSLMDPWIMSRSSPCQPTGHGSFVENVKHYMDFARLSNLLHSPCFPFLGLIIKISWGRSCTFAASLVFSASNLARRLYATSIKFLFSCFSSISLLSIEKLVVSCILILVLAVPSFYPFCWLSVRDDVDIRSSTYYVVSLE